MSCVYINNFFFNSIVIAQSSHLHLYYPMERRPYFGVAVIINIEYFDGERWLDRKGTSKDLNSLEDLWNKLHFNVEKHENLKSKEIWEKLSTKRDEINECQNSSCFVCCIMTHGSMGKIYGSDATSLDIKEVTDLFKESNCPALAGKPKMFFIQSCRDAREDHNQQPYDYITEAMPDKNPSAEGDADDESRINSELFVELANPNEKDFFIGYSTPPGKCFTKLCTWLQHILEENYCRV